MTTITLGGGPTVEQRREFAGLKEGTQVPGYIGYCPQLKYRIGRTYGEETHQLAKEYDYRKSSSPLLSDKKFTPLKLPHSTGDNKLTERMVPGYTGYIPRMPFKFGNTYREDCDYCIDEHMTNVTSTRGRHSAMFQTAASTPVLRPVSHDPQVRDKLNTYRDTHPDQPILMSDKRGATEPPIPGYNGYVPRIYTTEAGLGKRYNQMTQSGLDMFQRETDAHKTVLKQRISIDRDPLIKTMPTYERRLYPNGGMIPKYTGYVPQRRFNFGNTYGDTTRSLDVCAHPRESYGDFIKTQPRGITTTIA